MKEYCTNKTRFDIVIYHKNCPDGFTSAWVYWKLSGRNDKVTYWPETPNSTEYPDVRNKNVLILDVGYSKEITLEIAQKCNCLLIIDHHITNYEKIGDQSFTYFDMNHSACMLTWKYFYPNTKPPIFLQYVENHDLGKFDKTTEAFSIKFNFMCKYKVNIFIF